MSLVDLPLSALPSLPAREQEANDSPSIVEASVPPVRAISANQLPHWTCVVCGYRNWHPIDDSAQRCDDCFSQCPNIRRRRSEISAIGLELMLQLQQHGGLVANSSAIAECPICMEPVPAGAGIVLTECLHAFCRACVRQTCVHSETAAVRCPFVSDSGGCVGTVLDAEQRELLGTDEWAARERRSLGEAAQSVAGAFRCRTVDCVGWWIVDEGDDGLLYDCPLCGVQNCTRCKVSDEMMTGEF